MAFHQWILINMPAWLIVAVMIIVAIVVAVGGVLLVRRFVDVGKLKHHHDIAGPIYCTLGVVYAVLLAFVIMIVWQNYDRAQSDVIREANYYGDIYRDVEGLPEPMRTQLTAALDDYMEAIIDDEWKLMGSGKRSLLVQEKSDNLWRLFSNFDPQTENEKLFLAEIINKVNNAGELRGQRIADASSGIHPVLWFVLLFGGFITVAFTFFFGSENLGAQLIMTTMLAILIALILFTIVIMDFPFSGDLYISPSAFQQVLSDLRL
ncbi:MAG: DUF4239 domain-containing protein [Dehalococcoidia bacterium]|nr:DUF4239 domain-containing protein [Dehalococcoidia bacterium]